MNEQLSAFLDNEATRDEADSVVNALLRDESLRDSWTRQHWIRTTLRSHSAEPAVNVDTDFANRVMSAIAADDHPETVASSSNVVTMTPRRRTRRWRGVAGMAAAASVAGVVFLAGNPFVRSGTSGAEGRVAAANNSPTATRSDTVQYRATGLWQRRLERPIGRFQLGAGSARAVQRPSQPAGRLHA